MRTYDTPLEALDDLKGGCTDDFNLKPDYLECHSNELQLHHESFKMEEACSEVV